MFLGAAGQAGGADVGARAGHLLDDEGVGAVESRQVDGVPGGQHEILQVRQRGLAEQRGRGVQTQTQHPRFHPMAAVGPGDEQARRAQLSDVPVRGRDGQPGAPVPTTTQHHLSGGNPVVAAFSSRRIGRAKGRPVECRHTLVRGDRFVMGTTFERRDAYHFDLLGSPDRSDLRH